MDEDVTPKMAYKAPRECPLPTSLPSFWAIFPRTPHPNTDILTFLRLHMLSSLLPRNWETVSGCKENKTPKAPTCITASFPGINTLTMATLSYDPDFVVMLGRDVHSPAEPIPFLYDIFLKCNYLLVQVILLCWCRVYVLF